MDSLPRKCSKPSCKNTLPPEEPSQQQYKKCADCRAKNKLATTKAREKKRKRNEDGDEPPRRQAPTEPQDFGQNREEEVLQRDNAVSEQHDTHPYDQMKDEGSDTQDREVRSQPGISK
jgi:hypothetical protein